MTEPRYPYVVLEVPAAESDEASAQLFELGATGIEERDAEARAARARDWAASPVVGPEGDEAHVVLVASFASEDEAAAAAADLPASWSPRVEHVVGDGWRDEWKKYFEPFRLCEGIWVRPPWRALDASDADRVIVLEPGRAFGTGLHETTRLVAEAIRARAERVAGSPVLDVGCGSGVLSLVAVVLGASEVRAIDVDPEAVAVTRENAERNGVTSRIEADETPAAALDRRYPLVLANIEARTLTALAPAIAARVAPGGTLVLSGILGPEAGGQWRDVRAAYAELAVDEVTTRGEWLCGVLTRARDA